MHPLFITYTLSYLSFLLCLHLHKHTESFRGDFDYLEALLSDIAPIDSPELPQATKDDNDPSPRITSRRPLSMAPRAATAAFDLESTLKDLEDTFYNGLEGATLKRTTSVMTWPKEGPIAAEYHDPEPEPEPDPNKRDEVSIRRLVDEGVVINCFF